MFQDRSEAGLLLADKLSSYKKHKQAQVLAIPRGGIVIGSQIAKKLSLPLSIIVVKKLGAPGNPELAIGALAPGNVKYIDWDLALRSGVEQEYLETEIKDKSEQIKEREKKFFERSNLPRGSTSWEGKKIIILVDDGIATGATTFVAIKYIKQLAIRQLADKKMTIVLAIPVIAKETYNKLQSQVDKIVALEIPDSFAAVGQFYRDFPQVSDEEVIKLL